MRGGGRTHRGAVALLSLGLVVAFVGVGVSGGRAPAARGSERISVHHRLGRRFAPAARLWDPHPGGGCAPAGLSATRRPRRLWVGGSTSVVGQGAPLAIASQNCQPSAASGRPAGEFDLRGPVWGGGDGAEPIAIDQGRTLWLFGDTYVGGGPPTVRVDNRASSTTRWPCSTTARASLTCSGGPSDRLVLRHRRTGRQRLLLAERRERRPVERCAVDHRHADPHRSPGRPWGWQLVGVDVIHYQVSPSDDADQRRAPVHVRPTRPRLSSARTAVDQGSGLPVRLRPDAVPTQCFVARTNAAMHASSLSLLVRRRLGLHAGRRRPHRLRSAGGHAAPRGQGRVTATSPATRSRSWAPDLGVVGPDRHRAVRPHRQLWDANDRPTRPRRTATGSATAAAMINTSAGADRRVQRQHHRRRGGHGWPASTGPAFVTSSPTCSTATRSGASTGATVARGPTPRSSAGPSIPTPPAPSTCGSRSTARSARVLTADVVRPDVARCYPAFGPTHGFEPLSRSRVGVHRGLRHGDEHRGRADRRRAGCLRGWLGAAGPLVGFVAVTPTRLLDSRTATGGYSTPWSAGQTRSLQVAGVGPVPADATAVVMNVTVTDPPPPASSR